LIFDFDGLILETEEPVYLSWEELYQEYNCRLPLDKWTSIIGTNEMEFGFDPISELENLIGKSLDREKILPERRQREIDMVMKQPVLPGVQEYLKDAKRLGLKVGLASSSTCDWVTGHLARLGLTDYFDSIQASDDVPRTKPDPTLYLLALDGLGMKAGETVAFEDSPNGILAAKNAGLYCVAVPNVMTRNLALDNADMHLESLNEISLERLLEKVET